MNSRNHINQNNLQRVHNNSKKWAMNTKICFVLLLAIGISTQISEFEIDFDNTVNSVKLKDGRTLLDCPEDCAEVEETLSQCKCVQFEECKNNTALTCIEKGLNSLFTDPDVTEPIIERLKYYLKNHPSEDTSQLHKPVSPKHFLNFIQNLYQKLETLEVFRLRLTTPRLRPAALARFS